MNRRDFLVLAGAGTLIAFPAAPAMARMTADPVPLPAIPSFPAAQIAEIVSQVPGFGSFSQTATRSDGRIVTYHFAWAVGMGSLHYKSQYRSYFGKEEPAWALLEHPYHQFRLYKESVAADLPLPDCCPSFQRSDT